MISETASMESGIGQLNVKLIFQKIVFVKFRDILKIRIITEIGWGTIK